MAAVTTTRRRLPLPALLVPVLATVALPSAARAHRLDEYLQATLVDIEPGDVRLRINLTPGVDVSEQVLSLIDHDHDGAISGDEGAAYAASLKRDLAVRLDQRDVDLKLVTFDAPAPAELRTGWGIIRVEFVATPGPLAAGSHTIWLENRHLAAVSAYLFNAALPKSDSVRIARQERNENQSSGQVEFTFDPPTNGSRAGRVVAALAALLVAVFAPAWRTRKRSPPAA
jgi:hypothetical protein